MVQESRRDGGRNQHCQTWHLPSSSILVHPVFDFQRNHAGLAYQEEHFIKHFRGCLESVLVGE